MAFPVTGMFGRDEELEWLRARLADGAQLVTLTGPPGIGKTHLARTFAGGFGKEALFCEAMHATDADSLCLSIARSLKLSLGQDSSTESRAAILGRALANYKLIVLDNLEHIISESAPLIRGWLGAGTQILVTSRNALAVRGERLLELRPLEEDAAVQLFEERVRQLRPDFELEGVLESVRSITKELDGVPLALELAAGRSRVLSPAELLERLRDRFALLRSRERFGQWSTLEQAIDWSWQLLSDEEQQTAAECTLFRGSFDVAAAEAVLRGDRVLDGIDGLRDKSMLVTTGDDRLRLSMLSSIRAFCAEKLVTEQRAELRIRHAEYFADLANRFTPGADLGHLPSVQALADCQEDLRAVVNRYGDSDSDEHRRLVGSCLLGSTALVETQGVPTWLELAFDGALQQGVHSSGAESPTADVAAIELRAKLYLERSTLRRLRGALELSRADAELALGLCEPSSSLAGRVHRRLGMLDVDSGDLEAASERLRHARELFIAAGDERSLGVASTSLARALYAAGEHEEAEALCKTALALHATAELTVWEGLTHGYLAYICMDATRYEEAESHLERSVGLFRTLRSDSYEAAFLGLLGTLHHLQSRLDTALSNFVQAREAMERGGRRRLAAIHRGNEGIVLTELNRTLDAKKCLEHAIAELKAVGDETSAEFFVAHAAGCAVAAGDTNQAERLLASTSAQSPSVSGELLALQRAKLGVIKAPTASEAHGVAVEALREELARLEADSRGDVRIACRQATDFVNALERISAKLRVARDGSWFEVAGVRYDLRSREVLSRMVLALTSARLSGGGLTAAALIAATWPGERMAEASATSRLHSTVRRVRKMGLAEMIVHEHGEYRVSEETTVAWAEEGGAGAGADA
ncbi:MAG: tetratricopeptide repeat protein [Polyangiales bacterium]